jgi:hypothetical protein
LFYSLAVKFVRTGLLFVAFKVQKAKVGTLTKRVQEEQLLGLTVRENFNSSLIFQVSSVLHQNDLFVVWWEF